MSQRRAGATFPQNRRVTAPLPAPTSAPDRPRPAAAPLAVGGAAALGLAGLWPGAPAWAAWAARLALGLLLAAVAWRLMRAPAPRPAPLPGPNAVPPVSPPVSPTGPAPDAGPPRLSEHQVEQLIERERKRIAADLHDDLGAKLLTIVHTSESVRISSLAREALEEMRLSVRGLTGRAVHVGDALGDWRVEVVSRLSQAGIECDWQVPEDGLAPRRLSARAYVQATRILREAVSNVIRHSGASRCSVNCELDGEAFHLVVQDNGKGIAEEPADRPDRGHGLAGMKHRAQQLDGRCQVESGPGLGTVIRLTLPVDAPQAVTSSLGTPNWPAPR